MSQTITPAVASEPSAAWDFASTRTAAIPWYAWCGLCGASSIILGLYWDISWHMSIGRDTFWTPAHLAIQFGGILIGLTSAYLIFSTTWNWGGRGTARKEAVTVWGFRGPLGAFISCWGGTAMIASAPFDNWWHNAFGLDVRIISPPHAVLGLGIFAAGTGVLIQTLGSMNRAGPEGRRRLQWAFLYMGGALLTLNQILTSDYSDGTLMHTAIFYRIFSIAIPILLVGVARASGYRWGATAVAAIYMIWDFGQLWILPLFPATPKLGPVQTPITHMVPLGPPLFLIFPAITIDLLLAGYGGQKKWARAALLGIAFTGVLFAVQWPLGNFLLSPHARNWIFGMGYFPYQFPVDLHYLAWQFRTYEPTRTAFWMGIAIAAICGIVSARVGLAAGDAMRRLRR
jgi:hypothetical protein